MYRFLGCVAALVMILSAALAQTTPPATKKSPVAGKTSVARKSPVAAKKPATALQKNVAKKRAATTAANRKKTPAKPAVTWRNRQLQPTPERYKEIQQALLAKGYLQPEQATGIWDENSAGALKQFQAAQNIDASGKINSLSLIALGLGPKHEDTLPRPQPSVQPDQSR
jgi:peptidoglycan hydrolase-like protein with peptidoglycan-binding domain